MTSLISVIPLLLFVSTTALAQEHQIVLAGKTKATVSTPNGWINFYQGTNTLSFEDKSFLTVKIGSKLYTNSDQPPAGTQFLPVSTQSKEGDTVTNTWSISDVTFVQRVFPQYTKNGLKVATQFLASKTGAAAVSVGCQFLLDIALRGADGSPVLYRDDYLDQESKKYVGDIPSYLITSQKWLPNPPSYDPGLIAMAIYKDELNPQIDPSLLIVGHWPALERIPYLSSDYVVPSNTGGFDVGIVSQWPERELVNDSLRVVGGFAYGAADYTTCVGWAFSLLFVPEEITEQAMMPDRTIDAPLYIFNPDPVKDYQATITVRVDDALSLKGMEEYSNLTTYPARSYKHFSLPLILDTTSSAATATISLTAPPPMFLDECEAIVKVKRLATDGTPPFITNLTRRNGGDSCLSRRDTIEVTDDFTGLASIELVLSGYDAKYLTSGIFPSGSQTIELTIKDSLRYSHATIVATDIAGNTSEYQIEYCAIADTLAPRFIYTFNGKDGWDIVAHETRPWDRLLDHVGYTEAVNTYFTELTNSSMEDSTWLHVKILDPSLPASICVSAWDNAGNSSDTCLAYTGPSSVNSESVVDVFLVPNPATDRITLHGLGSNRNILIRDILGNVVTGFTWLDEKTISIRELPSGQYFMSIADRQIPFTVER
jgi:hypothetical protein